MRFYRVRRRRSGCGCGCLGSLIESILISIGLSWVLNRLLNRQRDDW